MQRFLPTTFAPLFSANAFVVQSDIPKGMSSDVLRPSLPCLPNVFCAGEHLRGALEGQRKRSVFASSAEDLLKPCRPSTRFEDEPLCGRCARLNLNCETPSLRTKLCRTTSRRSLISQRYCLSYMPRLRLSYMSRLRPFAQAVFLHNYSMWAMLRPTLHIAKHDLRDNGPTYAADASSPCYQTNASIYFT